MSTKFKLTFSLEPNAKAMAHDMNLEPGVDLSGEDIIDMLVAEAISNWEYNNWIDSDKVGWDYDIVYEA